MWVFNQDDLRPVPPWLLCNLLANSLTRYAHASLQFHLSLSIFSSTWWDSLIIFPSSLTRVMSCPGMWYIQLQRAYELCSLTKDSGFQMYKWDLLFILCTHRHMELRKFSGRTGNQENLKTSTPTELVKSTKMRKLLHVWSLRVLLGSMSRHFWVVGWVCKPKSCQCTIRVISSFFQV